MGGDPSSVSLPENNLAWTLNKPKEMGRWGKRGEREGGSVLAKEGNGGGSFHISEKLNKDLNDTLGSFDRDWEL